MKYCKHCGEALPNDSLYCPTCGEKVDHSSKDTIDAEEVNGKDFSYQNKTAISEEDQNLIGTLIRIFALVSLIIEAFAIIPLIWTIPMYMKTINKLNKKSLSA